jgi:putative DNA methylase
MPTRKLIEVALPLEAINIASAREKSIRHGHPSTMHLWWARRPLAACRAVLFASLVDDPSSHPERYPTEEAQQRERERLFGIIERLVQWENSNNEYVLREAREEILRHTNDNPPPVYDPFAGGGSIPLEAQRLGLEAHASDLNPVAVLINKALIEIPPKFANMPPVNPEDRNRIGAEWKGATGLAADVRYYGRWMRDEAEKRIGHLYPKAQLPKEYGGGEATVIAWLWARTVKCPNPACGAHMPLVRSFWLSTKKGKEAWVEPIITGSVDIPLTSTGERHARAPRVRFAVRSGSGKPPEGTVSRRGANCVCCNTSVPLDYIRAEGKVGRMGAQMMAIVAEGKKGRTYLPPNDVHEQVALKEQPRWSPETELPYNPRYLTPPNYGIDTFAKLFTQRQLIALTTFSELVGDAQQQMGRAAASAGRGGAPDHAAAGATYLAFAVDRGAESWCSLSRWQSTGDKVAGAFSRQALSMLWDYAEVNPFSSSTRNFLDAIEWIAEVLDALPSQTIQGTATQHNAGANFSSSNTLCKLINTDPPYYDNVPYADLSDFFYVWLRTMVKETYPSLMETLLVPKRQELVADPFRHGNKEAARRFFEQGLQKTFEHINQLHDANYPLTVYYAFKQTEGEGDSEDYNDNEALYVYQPPENSHVSTGWETMLEGLITAGFAINGTWPVRTERSVRTRSLGSNALASSIW